MPQPDSTGYATFTAEQYATSVATVVRRLRALADDVEQLADPVTRADGVKDYMGNAERVVHEVLAQTAALGLTRVIETGHTAQVAHDLARAATNL